MEMKVGTVRRTVSALSSVEFDWIIVALSYGEERYMWIGEISNLPKLQRAIGSMLTLCIYT
jgi:hypothetical protein